MKVLGVSLQKEIHSVVSSAFYVQIAKMSSKTHYRTSRINQGIETRFMHYVEKLKIDKRRFLRNMLHRQNFLKAEYKRLKDERFRNMSEKTLIRYHEIGKVVQIDDDVPTNGLMHCPGVQGRFNRFESRKNLKSAADESSAHGDDAEKRAIQFENDTQNHGMQHKLMESKHHSLLHFHPIRPTKSTSFAKNNSKMKPFAEKPKTRDFNGQTSSLRRGASFSAVTARNATGLRPGFLLKQNNPVNNQTSEAVGSFPQYQPTNSPSENQNEVPSRLNHSGRSHTAPLLSRLSVIKNQIIEEETEYILKLRKQSQQVENENVTEKVWIFIGKRPVSGSANFCSKFSPRHANKVNLQNATRCLSIDEDQVMLGMMKTKSRRKKFSQLP